MGAPTFSVIQPVSVLLLACLIALGACRGAPDTPEILSPPVEAEMSASQERPTRIILFIGDGMGLNAVAASSYVAGQPLAMLSMSEFGLITTHGSEFVTTDSAASASAFATGEKTHFEGVSVEPGTTQEQEEDPAFQHRTMVQAAQQAGWRTGLIATTRINHATPGPFASHRHQRHQYDEIALDLSRAGVDVLLGAGTDFFNEREDGIDLFEEMRAQGYEIATDAEAVREAATSAERLVGLMHPRDMPFVATGERAMDLDEMLGHALTMLDREAPEGFFLMVEGALIDWAGHAMDGKGVVTETLDMDRAVARALDYAAERTDTLVVVTADHETGAMDVFDAATAWRFISKLGGSALTRERTLPEDLSTERAAQLTGPVATMELGDVSRFGPEEIEDARLVTSFGYLSAASRAYWDGRGRFSAIHTPTLVPVFAQGVGARQVVAARDNADLGRQLMAFIDGVEPPIAGPTFLGGGDGTGMPKNVILLIGDGLGVSTLTAGYYHFGGLRMLEMPQRAAVATHGSDRLVNDSAATATAMATGHRTRRGVLGMAPQARGEALQPVPSVLEVAAKRGKLTGLVTTTAITDATPAAFYAKHGLRREEEIIAGQLVELGERFGRDHGVDFLIGGGARFLSDEHRMTMAAQGYAIHRGWTTPFWDRPNFYLLADRHLPDALTRQSDPDYPTLAQMTLEALRFLARGEEGFFLMVEGGQIDHRKHELDRGPRLLAELLDFDQALRVALDFAAFDEDTLVIVTSDHDHSLSVFDNHYGFHRGFCKALADCGGEVAVHWFDVNVGGVARGEGLGAEARQRGFGPPRIGLQYSYIVQQAGLERGDVTGPHSANFVPLFADGPGAAAFGGFLDQPQIGQWLLQWAAGGPGAAITLPQD